MASVARKKLELGLNYADQAKERAWRLLLLAGRRCCDYSQDCQCLWLARHLGVSCSGRAMSLETNGPLCCSPLCSRDTTCGEATCCCLHPFFAPAKAKAKTETELFIGELHDDMHLVWTSSSGLISLRFFLCLSVN